MSSLPTLSEAIARSPEVTSEEVGKRPAVQSISLRDLLGMEFPPRTNLLAPWLPTQGLAMLYGPRGIGKTYMALQVAFAVATGGSALRWSANEPAGVLYLDGEMPGVVLQDRLAAIVESSDIKLGASLEILTPDLQENGMPDLASEGGQADIDGLLTETIKLIVVDNLSTLVRSAKENEADSWLPAQGWALRQRSAGRSVLFVHHAGKGGTQRGTSRREDVLDTVIALRHAKDYDAKQGARFEVHFEKSRGFYGEAATPFEAALVNDERGRMTWTTRTLEESTYERVIALHQDEFSQVEIAEELGVHKSSVSRHLKKAREEGRIRD